MGDLRDASEISENESPATTSSQAPASEVELRVPREPQRLSLLESLEAMDRGLGDMYRAATVLINDPSYPDALALSAHAMRELMEKLPRVLDVPAGQNFQMGSRVKSLAEGWERAQAISACKSDDGWSGTIDEPLGGFLEDADTFFHDRARDWISQTQAASSLMRRLEPSGSPMSPTLSKVQVEAWRRTHQYFISVAHHHHVYEKRDTDLDEFLQHMRAVELLLLQKLRPRTAADYAEIDDLAARFLQS